MVRGAVEQKNSWRRPRSNAFQFAPFNINLNAICPGLLCTPMRERIAARRLNTDSSLRELAPRQAFGKIVETRISLEREQTPDDIGNFVAFLASEASRNMTGQAGNVNGGRYREIASALLVRRAPSTGDAQHERPAGC